ncbi:hypothetical protein [Winogradskyella sp. SYSU M77433]|uniref:hypothetical protein n=1 Tax=Winogradskyella sp. SYSU M77433 TaxID=3042722 RepID=UPI002480A1AD|nr:hypothetical protein [Winogradskyella sp. SYSU M77433]MDH7912968.1 hypothetical protein [Winogradskyella sp. SYSU M77433]
MQSIKDTDFYDDVLKELNYSFGNVFILSGIIVSEMNEGVVFSWEEHANQIVKDVINFTGSDGSDIVYISHRINSYSVVPTDWLKFFKNFSLKGYGIVCYKNVGFFNVVIENLFFTKKIRRFGNLEEALLWVKFLDTVET